MKKLKITQLLCLFFLLSFGVRIKAQQCTVNFIDSNYCVNGTKQFWNFASGTTSNTIYTWYFGDSNIPFFGQNPVHTYTANGTYSVCLTIQDSSNNCNSTICKPITINCINTSSLACNAAFTASPGCVNGVKQFYNTSTGTNSNTFYTWNFGNGQFAYTQNASHTFTANGNYNVCLTIQDSLTNCYSTKCNTININCVNISSLTCNAAFTPSLGCVNGVKQFINTSTGTTPNTYYTWNFGNGQFAYTQNASHTFTANGNYNVCLTIQDSLTNCYSTKCNTININCVNTSSLSCNAAFSSTGCINGVKQFYNTSTGTNSNTFYTWNFGNGQFAYTQNASHTYTANGFYNVCLTIQDSLTNCYSTKCNTININCVNISSLTCNAAFTPSIGCLNGVKHFINTSTGTTSNTNYSWNFGNGQFVYTQNASHTFTANGNYNVCLTIQDSLTNCYSTKCNIVNINCVDTSSSAACQAGITHSICINGTMQFWSSSTGITSNTNYTWNFGNGQFAYTQNASATYTTNGIYNVCLTIQDSVTNCFSTKCDSVYINCGPTSIKKASNESAVINVFPNPNNGTFDLQVKQSDLNSSFVEISINNMLGQEVYSSKEESTNGVITKKIILEDIANGAYFMRISTPKGINTSKIIINK